MSPPASARPARTQGNPRRRPDLAWREIEGCVVVVDPRTSTLHDLSEVASFYWTSIDGSRSLDDLAAAAAEEFDVDVRTARLDLERYVDELTSKGLLEPGAED